MKFNTSDLYMAPPPATIDVDEMKMIDTPQMVERPILTTHELGGSVTEGARFGSLLQTSQGSIRKGVGKLELATIQGGGEPGGVGSYGKEAREALKESAKVAETEIVSIHSPVNVGNLSGFNPQRGFVDEQRKQSLDEVKKAIEFSADVTEGSAVVVHTGEYLRPMSDQSWAQEKDPKTGEIKRYKFLAYDEEPGRANTYMVDKRNGNIISDIKKGDIIREPVYKVATEERIGTDRQGSRIRIKKGDYLDLDGNYLNPSNPEDLFYRIPEYDAKNRRFETHKLAWSDIVQRTDNFNKRNYEQRSPEEMAFRIKIENQISQARGMSIYHQQNFQMYETQREKLKESLKYYRKIEESMSEEEVKRIMETDSEITRYAGDAGKYISGDLKKPSEIIKKQIDDAEKHMLHAHESSSSSDVNADTALDTLNNVVSVDNYAKSQSFKSFAEAGLYAMKQSKEKKTNKPIFVAPENLWPEMGYGSHAKELIELVHKSRNKMVEYLTADKITDLHGRVDKDGNLAQIENPYKVSGLSKKAAEKKAYDHIKATFDTQHMGMWQAYFTPKPNETPEDTKKRFDKWYLEQVKELEDADIIGHIHLVDSITSGHHHLPAGQGSLPVVTAIEYLKKKGYTGTIISEGWEEDSRFGEGRQLEQAWKAFGSPVYRSEGMPSSGATTFGDIHRSYLGRVHPPMFVYGAYSPSNDFQLWSEVPME